jgi:hypothetical protein
LSKTLVPSAVRILSPLLLILALFDPAISAAPVPPEAEEAAQTGLAAFLRDIPAGELANFGITPDEDHLRSELGVPFPVYTINPEALFTIPQVDAFNLSPFVFGEQGGGEAKGYGGYSTLKGVGRNAARLRAAVADNLDQ